MKIRFNGKEIVVDDNSNIIIDKDKIIVDGEHYTEDFTNNVKIIIEGNVENLAAKVGSVEVKGYVNKIDCGGSVQCKNVNENIDCGGSLQCNDISGNVNAGGSVIANVIKGSVKAGGSITC
jgi:hypothetical protein